MTDLIIVDLAAFHYPADVLAANGFSGDAYRVSTWDLPLDFDSHTWEGKGGIIDIKSIVAKSGSAAPPIQVTISGIPEKNRRLYAQDAGVVDVTLYKIFSTDGGANWDVLRGPFRGTVSYTVGQGGQFVVDVDTRQVTDIDRGAVQYRGAETAPDGDEGWAQTTALERGISNFKFPN